MAKKYLTLNPASSIDVAVNKLQPDRVLIVTDSNVATYVLPKIADSEVVSKSPSIIVPPGEEFKNLDSVIKIWNKLEDIGATRQSLIINIGGGVVTDMGGFAAACFKRGIRTLNFPTTLLGAVDAATGGKTGIDFHGLKNEVGAFHHPSDVIISALPFRTLPEIEMLSGYAEMIKTALISDRDFYVSLLDKERIVNNETLLGEAVEKCVVFKEDIVANDPKEKGLRKILNFGHTAGHAFESLRIQHNLQITHGHAVAHGMLVALILSHLKLGFQSDEVHHYKMFLKENYGDALVKCGDLDEVIEKMNSDKKNRHYGEPVFTLLSAIGVPEINISPTQAEIKQALELYLDMMG